MKKKIIITLIIITLTLIIGLTGVFFYVYPKVRNKEILLNDYFVKDSDIIGADVSVYQGNIDFDVLATQNIKFVYIKATEGSIYQDVNFKTNWENANRSPLPCGAYHFFSYDSAGKTQADNFIETVGELKNENLIPVVDVEYYGDKHINKPRKEDVVRELKSFVDEIEKRYGVKPMIYTRPDLYREYLKGDFDGCKKWITSLYYPIQWDYRDDWCLWQFTELAELDGYWGDGKTIDLNILNRKMTLDELKVGKQ